MRSGFSIQAWLLVAAALASFRAQAVDPAELNLITFENRTGDDIQYIFLSPADSQYWGTDLLGSTRVLANDDELGFYIHYPERCNAFDIYAVGASNAAYLQYGHKICDGNPAEVRLTRRNLDDEAPDFAFATVTIENATDAAIWYLFFSPGDSEMWGVDQLDQSTILEPGDSLSMLLPVGEELVRYDIRAVDENEATYTVYVEIDSSRKHYVYTMLNEDIDP
jgi:hypothetical protein